MITCNKCNFIVNGNLKHSIRSNSCPSCGSNLLDNEQLKIVRDIQRELNQNGFTFSEEVSRNLSIFFMNKYVSISSKPEAEETFAQDETDLETNTEEVASFSEDTLRDEIKKEMGIYDENTFSEIEEDESEDRISRLRRMAKDNPILNKRGISVRRVSGD